MIYFIQAKNSGNVKIGVSNDPKRRLDTMQTGSPEPLELLGTLPGEVAEEKQLHRRFNSYRVRGEWFRGVPEFMRQVLAMVQTPIAEIFAQTGAQVWRVIGDSGNDPVDLVCVTRTSYTELPLQPNAVLVAPDLHDGFYGINYLFNVTHEPDLWLVNPNSECLRVTLISQKSTFWVCDPKQGDLFTPGGFQLRYSRLPPLHRGQTVVHPEYGFGKVIAVNVIGKDVLARVRFDVATKGEYEMNFYLNERTRLKAAEATPC